MFKIPERIKSLRKEKEVTQRELAEAIGVQVVSVQRFEYGSVRPSLDTLVAIADYFGCSVDYLLGRTDKKEINR